MPRLAEAGVVVTVVVTGVVLMVVMKGVGGLVRRGRLPFAGLHPNPSRGSSRS